MREGGDSQSVLAVLEVSVSHSLTMTEQEEPSEEQPPPAAASYSSPSSEEEMAENYQRADLGSAGTIKVTK